MAITIKTRLHDGIYKSDGGGEVRIKYKFATGPRNLLKAIKTLHEHRTNMVLGFGNIGCGVSWLEIDGQRIDWVDLEDVMVHETGASCRTMKATKLISDVGTGAYLKDR